MKNFIIIYLRKIADKKNEKPRHKIVRIQVKQKTQNLIEKYQKERHIFPKIAANYWWFKIIKVT